MVELNKFEELLAEYVAFQSISTDPKFKSQINETVEWLVKLFKDSNFSINVLRGPKTNPIIVARYHQSDDMETVLVYGHYDVQPVQSQLRDWNSDPFKLSKRNGRLYGRGVVDNKGQNLIHILTVIELIKQGKLAYNVVFMLEGNEETGNDDMSDIIKNNVELLKTDFVIVSDGEVVGNVPAIESSLRGGRNVRIVIQGAPKDLHSGEYGGAAPNPGLIAAHVAAQLKSLNGRVNIPGFYDGMKKISVEQQASLTRLPSDETIRAMIGVKSLVCEEGMSFFGQVGMRPTLEITGLGSGYTDKGYQNIIPAKADMRLNFRFVPGQNPKTIQKNLKKMLAEIIPSSVDYKVTATQPWRAVEVGVSSPKAMEIKKLILEIYGEEPVLRPVGASIPIVSDFQDFMGIDALLVSLGNPDCNMHGPDENYLIDLMVKGLRLSWSFFSKGAK